MLAVRGAIPSGTPYFYDSGKADAVCRDCFKNRRKARENPDDLDNLPDDEQRDEEGNPELIERLRSRAIPLMLLAGSAVSLGAALYLNNWLSLIPGVALFAVAALYVSIPPMARALGFGPKEITIDMQRKMAERQAKDEPVDNSGIVEASNSGTASANPDYEADLGDELDMIELEASGMEAQASGMKAVIDRLRSRFNLLARQKRRQKEVIRH